MLTFSVRATKPSFSISHISSHFARDFPLPHGDPMLHHIIYTNIHYLHIEQILKNPPFRSHLSYIYRFAPRPRWKCQESQKDLPLLSRTHFLCMATTAKMALLQVKKTCFLRFSFFFFCLPFFGVCASNSTRCAWPDFV